MTTPWYRGTTPPGRSDDWKVTTVAQRSMTSDETFVCAATGDEIPSSTSHLYVTARREAGGYKDEFEHYVIVDEDALRDWLGADE